jgi:hypothetical protein
MCGRAGIPFPVSRSMDFLPAVDIEGGAGDVLRPIGGWESSHLTDVFRRLERVVARPPSKDGLEIESTELKTS